MLRDDAVIEIFDSPDRPPDWIEGVDVENGEYEFCDDRGQRYVGVITRSSSWWRQPEFELRPEGQSNVKTLSLDPCSCPDWAGQAALFQGGGWEITCAPFEGAAKRRGGERPRWNEFFPRTWIPRAGGYGLKVLTTLGKAISGARNP